MITENMIKAGRKEFFAQMPSDPIRTINGCDSLITSIYEAMTDQKQKDAIIAYNASVEENEAIINSIGHSSR